MHRCATPAPYVIVIHSGGFNFDKDIICPRYGIRDFLVLEDVIASVFLKNDTFKKLSSRGRLTEQHLDEGLKEVRRALLEADVHFSVVREFLENVRSRSLNTEVLQSLSPTQQIIKIVNEELTQILGGDTKSLTAGSRETGNPNVIMIIGLQGAGKTTTAAKLALHLKKQNMNTMLVAVDLQRPAAIEQLVTLGNQIETPVYEEGV
ncbi:signal recognition particle receptor subunit alpha, partial [Dehalococcoidia bacterium]|nr:signal recognition particle receptor subunit alpha [Dehalococcoidia bacterium]